MEYGDQYKSPELLSYVDSISFNFLNTLGEISYYFPSLQVITPMLFRTPTQERLEAYEEHLLAVETYLHPKLDEFAYLLTRGLLSLRLIRKTVKTRKFEEMWKQIK